MGILNSIVHIVMYSYYLAAAVLSQQTVAKMTNFKRCITILQMTQFALIFVYVAIHRLWYKCIYNDFFVAIFAAAVAVMFYTFYDFYKKSYKKNTRKSKYWGCIQIYEQLKDINTRFEGILGLLLDNGLPVHFSH